ncbi:hypothetical protein RIF29_27564 [Crotalaria pallida]|uniref:Uncharacterized protein n=1 Tax=Crotalaria pallida TaxID=3830 RepID=A0AAN9ERN7_CROPI
MQFLFISSKVVPGSGIPASKNRDIKLIAIYHKFCVQVPGAHLKAVLMESFRFCFGDLKKQFQLSSNRVRMSL